MPTKTLRFILPVVLCWSLACSSHRSRSRDVAPLSSADLALSGIAVDTDTTVLLRAAGPPATRDSLVWTYEPFAVALKQGKVAIVSADAPGARTVRGLSVGDSISKVRELYRACYENDTLYQVCWTVDGFDERAVVIALARGRVTRISVGRILEP